MKDVKKLLIVVLAFLLFGAERQDITVNTQIENILAMSTLPHKETVCSIERKTPYSALTSKEISLLEVTVQHEVGAFSDEYKTLVAELIYNRLVSEEFPNTVEGVLFQENQFCGIENWYSPDYEVDESTKKVVKDVFSKTKTSHKATYYYNPELSDRSSVIWFECSGDVKFLFEHTEENWGIEYTTRFFR